MGFRSSTLRLLRNATFVSDGALLDHRNLTDESGSGAAKPLVLDRPFRCACHVPGLNKAGNKRRTKAKFVFHRDLCPRANSARWDIRGAPGSTASRRHRNATPIESVRITLNVARNVVPAGLAREGGATTVWTGTTISEIACSSQHRIACADTRRVGNPMIRIQAASQIDRSE